MVYVQCDLTVITVWLRLFIRRIIIIIICILTQTNLLVCVCCVTQSITGSSNVPPCPAAMCLGVQQQYALVSSSMLTLPLRCPVACSPCPCGVQQHAHPALAVSSSMLTLPLRCPVACSPCPCGVQQHAHPALAVSSSMLTLPLRCPAGCSPCPCGVQ